MGEFRKVPMQSTFRGRHLWGLQGRSRARWSRMIEGDGLRTSAVEAGPLRTVSAVKNENEGQGAQRGATLRHAVARL